MNTYTHTTACNCRSPTTSAAAAAALTGREERESKWTDVFFLLHLCLHFGMRSNPHFSVFYLKIKKKLIFIGTLIDDTEGSFIGFLSDPKQQIFYSFFVYFFFLLSCLCALASIYSSSRSSSRVPLSPAAPYTTTTQ